MPKILPLLFLSLTFFINNAFAQNPNPQAGAGRGGFGGKLNVGHFYGRVVDSKTGKGVEFASVQLTQSKFDTVSHTKKDVIIAGQLTTGNGNFSLENLPVFGTFKLTISGMGYAVYTQDLSFNLKAARGGDQQQMMNAVDKDLGNIAISVSAVALPEVTVNGDAPTYELKIDKKVYNVEKDQTAAGGTAQDVLKNVPSVNVDIDGNVTMRNATPQIFVDGLPTTLTIDQIPADDIQSIEVISNPSAKYDASGGGGGILNIVLKKNHRVGYNGSLRAGIDSRARVNAGGELNARQGKINFFISGNFNQRDNHIIGNTGRTYIGSEPSINLVQKDTNINKGYFATGRAGVDWFIDNRNTLTVSGSFNHADFSPVDTNTTITDTVRTNGNVANSVSRITGTKREFQNLGATLSFKHLYPKDGNEWTSSVNYNGSNSSNSSLYYTQNYDPNGAPLGSPVLQQQTGSGIVQYTTLQTDYVNPITDKIKIEAGARAAIRDYTSSLNNLFYDYPDTSNHSYQEAPSLINDYKYTDQVYAAYFTLSQQIHKFGYELGLRGESSFYKGTIASDDSTYSHTYPISLFPSAYLSYKLNDNNNFQLNYTRRVNRPNFFQLLPYTDYTDSLNLTKGNPNLKPEFTNSLEASWQKIFNKKNNILTSIYFKNTTDLITSYNVLEYDPVLMREAIIGTYENANSAYAYGAEFTSQNSVTKWMDISLNVNAYNSFINATNLASNLKNQQFSWFSKLNTTVRLPKNFTLQITGDYHSKTALPMNSANTGRGFGGGGGGGFGGGSASTAQGYQNPTYGVDASLKFEFLKNKAASINFSISDIFRTRVQSTYTETAFFSETIVRYRDPQYMRLNFTYRFGKFDVSLFKRKNTQNNDVPDIMPGG